MPQQKSPPTHRTQTYYTPIVLDEKLTALAAKLSRSKSEIIRRALFDYMPKLEAEVKEVGELAIG